MGLSQTLKTGLWALITALSSFIAPTSFACSVALVLALDGSASVDWRDYVLQQQGLVTAFQDPEVAELITLLPGGIAVTVFEWSDAEEQTTTVEWTPISTPQESVRFANSINASMRSVPNSHTGTGAALLYAQRQLEVLGDTCLRRVIDVSSDGQSNYGPKLEPIADHLDALGTTINVLAIIDRDPTLPAYFERSLARGPGAFVEIATSYQDYARAIKKKLIRELAPGVGQRNPDHDAAPSLQRHFARAISR